MKARFSNPVVAVTAIAAIALLEWQAISHSIDGAYLAMVIAAIAGIAGYAVQPKVKGE